MSYRWAECRYSGAMQEGYEDRAVPEDRALRAPAGRDVFEFQKPNCWRSRIRAMLSDVITPGVQRRFCTEPPQYVVSDDLSWLDNIIRQETGREVDIKDLTADRLSREYRTFRGAHATRTDNLTRFYESGLRVLRAGEVETRVRDLFLTPEFSYVDEEKLAGAIEDVGARNIAGGREGWLYFCADERSLLTRAGGSGHYLVYGGEYLYCLAMRLVGRRDAERKLKSIGRPTMFVCDIPMNLLRERTLSEFSGMILEFLFCELIGEQSHSLAPGAGSALSLPVDLPGEHIVGHYHPATIYDPFA